MGDGLETPESITIEWSYKPPNYFEESVTLVGDSYRLIIDDGKAIATVDARFYDSHPSVQDELTLQLEDRFLGAQLINRVSYELSRPVVIRHYLYGRRNISLSAEAEVLSVTADVRFDVVHKDAAGTILSDSRQDRIEERLGLSELVARYRRTDTTLEAMLTSFDRAVRDSANELIYLAEIMEAFNRTPARRCVEARWRELDIYQKQDKLWSQLGRLANNEPLNQGRHRGRHVGELRDASAAELEEARRVAKEIIVSYLKYLEDTQRSR